MLQTSLGAGRFRVHLVGWVLAAAALFGGAVMIPSEAVGATPSTDYPPQVLKAPDLQSGGRFGSRMVATGDLNRDGTNDLLVSAQGLNAGGVNGSGRVYAVSGKTREVLYRRDSPEPQVDAAFGAFLQGPGDLNGDGTPDFVVGSPSQDVFTGTGTACGTPEPNGCNEDQGKAFVFSGTNGALLYALDNPAPQSNASFGARLGRAGNLTPDGTPELIVGASSNDKPAGCGNSSAPPAGCRKDEGQAFIFNGATGQLIRTLDLPAADRQPPDPATCTTNCGAFGGAVQSPGDVNGDGVADQQVDAFSYSTFTGSGTACGTPEPNGCNEAQGRIYLFSGANGQLIRRIDHPFPAARTFFGFQDVTPNSPGDVTGDKVPDIYAAALQKGDFQGGGYVFNGATGALVYPLRVPSPQVNDDFFTMDKTDYNKDGTPDLYVGRQAIDVPADQNGGTFVYDGRDGSLLKRLELPTADRQMGITGNFGPFLGFALAAPGDLNGDGEPDYVATSMRYDEGPVQDAGRVYFFLSNVPPPNVPGGGGYPLPPGGGGGGSIPPKATVCRNSPGVKIIGKTNSGGRVFQGSNGNDRICGTSAGDSITGNGGRDVISGGGGNDRINGGSGSDRVNGNSGKDLISGSSGNDSISGSSGNDRVNGNSGKDRINGNSGNDRLAGASGNDVISGSTGKDIISGGSGNDRLSGNSGNDRINGDSGNDRISGGSGNDRLKGASGNDRIDGGRGRDRISGGSGRNKIKQ